MTDETVRRAILDLSKREIEVLYYICQGMENSDICDELHLSRTAVTNRVSAINKQLKNEGSSNTEKRRNLIKVARNIVKEYIPNREAVDRWEIIRLEELTKLDEPKEELAKKASEEQIEHIENEIRKSASILLMDKIEGLFSFTGDPETAKELLEIKEGSKRDEKQREEIARLEEKIDSLENKLTSTEVALLNEREQKNLSSQSEINRLTAEILQLKDLIEALQNELGQQKALLRDEQEKRRAAAEKLAEEARKAKERRKSEDDRRQEEQRQLSEKRQREEALHQESMAERLNRILDQIYEGYDKDGKAQKELITILKQAKIYNEWAKRYGNDLPLDNAVAFQSP